MSTGRFSLGSALVLMLIMGIGIPAAKGTAQSGLARIDQAAADQRRSVASPPERPSRGKDPLEQPLTFNDPADPPATPGQASSAPARLSLGSNMTTLVGGLASCVGAFLLFVWATRRSSPPGLAQLPSEVLEPLGRSPLNARHYLQLVRLGGRLILLNVSAQGATAVAEITDADEVNRLAGMCQRARPQSVTSSFREVLGEAARVADQEGYFTPVARTAGERIGRAGAGRVRS